jgi:hypothetical protein
MKRWFPLHLCILITAMVPVFLLGASSRRSGINSIERKDGGLRPSGRAGRALHKRVSGSAPGKVKASQDLSALARFPFEVDLFQYTSAFPVVLGNGNLMVVFASDYEGAVRSSQSPDSGASWTDPSPVASAGSVDLLTGIRTSGGRIIAVWREFLGGSKLSMCRSDDDGASWSDPVTAVNTGVQNHPTLSQTADGRIWFFYSWTGDWIDQEVRYRTSDDNGDSWSPDRIFSSHDDASLEVQVISAPGGPHVAVVSEGDAGGRIYAKESPDGGETWSAPRLISDSLSFVYQPRMLRREDGTLIMIRTRREKTWWDPDFDYNQSSVEISTSPDGGAAWSGAVPLTRYAGFNETAGACLFNGRPFVVFVSDRWQSVPQLWRGLAGLSADENPPPVIIGLRAPELRANRPVPVQVIADDETGVAGVTLSYAKNGDSQGSLAMADDGRHGDGDAGDKVWGASVGPFDLGDAVDFTVDVSDVDANAVEAGNWRFVVPSVHDAGNVVLQFWDDSMLGRIDVEEVSGFWPRDGGQGYLALGGFWAGVKSGGEKRVMNLDWDQSDWKRTEGSRYSIAPGVSDQDGDVTYDDLSASSDPIGLRVHQRSFQWSAGTRDDFILFKYTVKNLGAGGGLDSLFAGQWLDPDVGWDDWSNDLVGYDGARNLLYVRNAANDPTGFLGVRLLGRAVPHTVNTFSYQVGDGDPADDGGRYDFMTNGKVTLLPDTADYHVLMAAPPVSLAAGDSFTVAYGIVLGNGLEELQANADTMEAVYEHMRTTGVEVRNGGYLIPGVCELRQNYPNPFNTSTSIEFVLPGDRKVVLKVYNTMGEEVAVLAEGAMKAGRHAVRWDASGRGSGIYFYRLQAGDFSETRKLLLLK